MLAFDPVLALSNLSLKTF